MTKDDLIDLRHRVADRLRRERQAATWTPDVFQARAQHWLRPEPWLIWADGWLVGQGRALQILKEEMTAWPKGTKAWRALQEEVHEAERDPPHPRSSCP
jgi:hypothetical protein